MLLYGKRYQKQLDAAVDELKAADAEYEEAKKAVDRAWVRRKKAESRVLLIRDRGF